MRPRFACLLEHRNRERLTSLLFLELRKTKRATKEVLGDIQRVDNRLVVVQRDLQDTTERLGESRMDQRRVAAELEVAEENLAKTKEQVRKRLKRMYGQLISLAVLSELLNP